MPFRYGDENENVLPDGMTEEVFRNLVAAAVADGVVELLQKALDDSLYITQDGLRVCRFTGKIVDEPEGRKK